MDRTNKYQSRLTQLEADATSWRTHWADIQSYLCPRKGRYLAGSNIEDNDGDIKNDLILNGTGTRASQTLADGIQGGMTSPSRKWFEVTLSDPDLADLDNVKRWLEIVGKGFRRVFSMSNFYGACHNVYHELAIFGTGPILIEPDPDTVIRCKSFTAGEYYLGLDNRYRPDSLYRRFAMSAKQLVDEFGIDAVSSDVKSCYNQGAYDTRFKVVHAIQPRSDWVPRSEIPRQFPFESIYFQEGEGQSLLRESGYREIPFAAPRWWVDGSDVYGRSPAMECLADVKGLQKLEELKLRALDKMVNPPMVAPSRLRGATIVAGGVNYLDLPTGQQGFKPAYEIRPDTQSVSAEIQVVEQRIRAFFYNDLFMTFDALDGRMTATEAQIRNSEKLLLLGPVIERIEAEFLDPIFARVYSIMDGFGLIPEPPREIQGKDWEIRYVGVLAQAQRSVDTRVLEQVAIFTQTVAAAQVSAGQPPDVMDMVDWDALVEQHAELSGVPPTVMRGDDDVMAIREARQQAQQAQVQAMQAQQLVESAKTMSETRMDQNSALDRISQMSGA